MVKRLFQGVYGIVLTPFCENGSIDYRRLAEQAYEAASSKYLAGLVVCGSTGEFSRMSFEENANLMKTVRETVGDKQFICGATASDSFTANRYVECASGLGADGILIAPPYYFSLNEEEIFAYYEDVLKNNAARIPIIGYNIPQCTNAVSVKNFEKLLSFECFKGFKNSWNDMQEIVTEISLRDQMRADVSMLTGLDACLYGTLALGGDGLFTAISYLMPDVMGFIYENYDSDREKTLQCQKDLIKLIRIVGEFTFPYGYRVLSEAMGKPLGRCREAVPLTSKNKAIMAKNEMLEAVRAIRNTYIKN